MYGFVIHFVQIIDNKWTFEYMSFYFLLVCFIKQKRYCHHLLVDVGGVGICVQLCFGENC